jgi:hypothetical protein
MARASALRCGISVHEWLDRLIRDAAAGTGDGSVTKR